MRSLLTLFCSLIAMAVLAQTPSTDADFFKFYGMPNSDTYTSFKDAFGDAKKGTVYKLNTAEPAPKKLDKLSTVTSLQLLKLSNNGISALPENIGNLGSLIYFKSENNPLKTLPASIGGWGSLIYLKLVNTAMDSLPKEVGYLDKLKEWEWIGNKGDTIKLPKEIRYMRNLKKLDMDSVLLDTLPNVLAMLTELKDLNLSACNLNILPEFFGTYKGKETGLTKLESLRLPGNNLSSLPTTLFYCRALRVLDLSNNKLESLPDDICWLKKLEILDLRGNNFSPFQLAVLKGLLPECTIYY